MSITPPGGSRAFSGLDVARSNAQTVVVAERIESALGNNRVYASNDAGRTWQTTDKKNISLDLSKTWGSAQNWSTATADLAIDPTDAGRVWITTWFGVWRTNNISVKPSVWKPIVAGHEELVTHTLISPTSGAPLISGVADHGGFRHIDPVNSAPTKRLADDAWRAGRQRIQDTQGLDFAANDPDIIVRVGSREWTSSGDGELSTDNGRTWSLLNRPTANPQGGNVAISASASSMVWAPRQKGVYVSSDLGQTWVSSQFSAPFNATLIKDRFTPKQLIASDRVLDNQFYLYDYTTRSFYRSVDGGFNWARTTADLSALSTNEWEYQTVKAVPGRAGHVWLNSARSGLYRSNNGGSSFIRVLNVQRALSFGFGAPAPGASTPTVFLYGKITGFADEYKIFRSDDDGVSWIDITGNKTLSNSPKTLTGDSQTYGRVYVGTGGRGVYYGVPQSGNPDPPAPTVSVFPTSVNEGGGVARINVQLSGVTNQTVSVELATNPDDAQRGVDYYGTYKVLSFSPGESTKTVEVSIIDDSTKEPTEAFNVRLFRGTGVNLGNATASISILDND